MKEEPRADDPHVLPASRTPIVFGYAVFLQSVVRKELGHRK